MRRVRGAGTGAVAGARSPGRAIAFEVLRRVEEGGAYASRALDAALASAGALDPREAGLATELVYGTLRRALALDAALARHSSRPPSEADPAARVALRLGAYELLHLRTAPHAAVSEAVALAKGVDHGRAAGFVNAVLRALAAALAADHARCPRRRWRSTRPATWPASTPCRAGWPRSGWPGSARKRRRRWRRP